MAQWQDGTCDHHTCKRRCRGRDCGRSGCIYGSCNEYPVFDSIEKCDVEADVVIDFSNAKAVDGLLDYCVEKQIPVVLCTTGLSEEQLQKVEEASKKVAVLRSANMSLGINLFDATFLKEATKYCLQQVMILKLLRSITTRNWMPQVELCNRSCRFYQ